MAAVLCRAGLYKQLAELKGLVAEYRENPEGNAALKVSPAISSLITHTLDHAKQAAPHQGYCESNASNTCVNIKCRAKWGPKFAHESVVDKGGN